ncbi:MAG: transcription elongation factor GreA [bacterium]
MIEGRVITREKLEDLKKQLHEYKTKKRVEVAKRIKEAKEYGDLSENSEYEEAKNQQAFVEGKIAELKDIIKNAKILKCSQKNGTICAGSKITLQDAEGKEHIYTLVGALESDPAKGKISIESPLGQACMNKEKNDSISVNLPAGKTEFKIINVE